MCPFTRQTYICDCGWLVTGELTMSRDEGRLQSPTHGLFVHNIYGGIVVSRMHSLYYLISLTMCSFGSMAITLYKVHLTGELTASTRCSLYVKAYLNAAQRPKRSFISVKDLRPPEYHVGYLLASHHVLACRPPSLDALAAHHCSWYRMVALCSLVPHNKPDVCICGSPWSVYPVPSNTKGG